MATLTINNSNSPTAMRLRLTYTAGAGSVSITKIESCRTDSYDTSAWKSGGFTMSVNIGGSTTNVSLTSIYFNKNSSYSTVTTNTISNNNCSGTTSIKITFSNTGNTNINNANFSTSVDAGYKSPSMGISNTAKTLNTATFSCTYSNATPTSIQIYNNTTGSVAYSGSSLTPTVTGLTPNTTYSFKVRGYANGVWGDYSSSTSVTTLRQAYFGTITNINNTSSQLSIQATNPSGATTKLSVYGYNSQVASMTTLVDNATVTLSTSQMTTLTYSLTSAMISALNSVASNTSQIDVIYELTTTQNNVSYTTSYTGKYNIINSNPSISTVTYLDTNNTTTQITNNNQKIIINQSTVSITFSKMTLLNEAREGSYNIILNNTTIGSIQGTNANTYTYNVGTIPTTSSTLQIEAIDSRQLSSRKTVSLDLVNYSSPYITQAKAIRQNYVEEATTLTASGTFSNIFSNTILSIQYQYKESGTTQWSALQTLSTFTVSGNQWSIQSPINGDTSSGYNVEKNYDLKVIVTDKLSSSNQTTTIDSISPLVWYKKSEKKVGIGKKPSYSLDVKGDSNISGSYRKNGTDILELVYPVGSIYLTLSTSSPATLFGFGTWVRIGTGRTLISAGGGTDPVADSNNNTGDGEYTGQTTWFYAGMRGGEMDHTLTTAQLPAHTHGSKSLTGAVDFRTASSSFYDIVGYYYNSTHGILSSTQYTWSGSHGALGGLTNYTNPKVNRLSLNATHEHNSVGSGSAHNIMQPYLSVYMWQRTA